MSSLDSLKEKQQNFVLDMINLDKSFSTENTKGLSFMMYGFRTDDKSIITGNFIKVEDPSLFYNCLLRILKKDPRFNALFLAAVFDSIETLENNEYKDTLIKGINDFIEHAKSS